MSDRAGQVGREIITRVPDRREGDNHPVHEQKYQFAIDQTRDDRVFQGGANSPANQVVNRRGAKRDREMAKKSDRSRSRSHLARMRTKDPAGNSLQDSKRGRADETEGDKSLTKITETGQEPAPKDGGKRSFGKDLHLSVRPKNLQRKGEKCLELFRPEPAERSRC